MKLMFQYESVENKEDLPRTHCGVDIQMSYMDNSEQTCMKEGSSFQHAFLTNEKLNGLELVPELY